MTQGNWPSIDHSLLSPNGRMSKRARKAAEAREFARLFKGIGDLKGTPISQPSEKEQHLAQAARLRDLASRGMCVKKYTKEADRLEALALTLP